MRQLSGLIIAAAIVLGGRAVSAQGMSELPIFYPLEKAAEGTFSKYAVKLPNGSAVALEIALVGREAGAHWIEWAMKVPGKGEMAIKMLVADEVKRMLVQQSGMPQPMELPPNGVSGGAPKVTRPDAATLVSEDSLKTAAGSFKAKHYRKKVKTEGGEATIDLWAAEGAAPLGLVKMVQSLGAQSTSMELVATGKGARSHITGVPIKAPEGLAPAKATGGPAPGKK